VDQDQSDNVTTTYRVDRDGRTAPAAAAIAGDAGKLVNGSDNRLLSAFVAPALGCTPFTAADLGNGGQPTTALALNELQAAAGQTAPVALVPPNDPMVLVDGKASPAKTNAYRAGVNQPNLAPTETAAAYCRNLTTVAPPRLQLDKGLLRASPSPEAGTNLYDFLVARLKATNTVLGCQPLPAAQDPMQMLNNGQP
jgi:hypothetical protein